MSFKYSSLDEYNEQITARLVRLYDFHYALVLKDSAKLTRSLRSLVSVFTTCAQKSHTITNNVISILRQAIYKTVKHTLLLHTKWSNDVERRGR